MLDSGVVPAGKELRYETLLYPCQKGTTLICSNSRLDAAGKFAGSLLCAAFLQIRGTWNQYFAVVQRNLPAASRLELHYCGLEGQPSWFRRKCQQIGKQVNGRSLPLGVARSLYPLVWS